MDEIFHRRTTKTPALKYVKLAMEKVQSFRYPFANMSGFFAVLLLLLSAVVCQIGPFSNKGTIYETLTRDRGRSLITIRHHSTNLNTTKIKLQNFHFYAAPQQNSNPNLEEQDSTEHPVSEPVAPIPATESLPPSSPSPQSKEKLPTPLASPVHSPLASPVHSPLASPVHSPLASPVHSPLPSPIPFTPPSPLSLPPQPQSPLSSFSPPPSPFPQSPPPQFLLPPSSPPQFLPPPSSPPPSPPSPQCPPQVPPCPTECQALPKPVPPPPAPPKKKPYWLVNLFNNCVTAVMQGLNNLIVVTGEKPPKSRNSEIFVSFGKKGKASKQPKNCDASNPDSDDDQVDSVGCFWYKDYRRNAPRTRVASCVANPNGHGTQCNFCCVGHKVIECNNCLTINCNPTINCCSCTINITIVNNVENTGQKD